MLLRFTLNENGIDANLCARIRGKAGGGSVHEAAKFLLRFWHEQENCQNLTPERSKLVTERSDIDKDNDSQEINLSGLDSIFSDTGE